MMDRLKDIPGWLGTAAVAVLVLVAIGFMQVVGAFPKLDDIQTKTSAKEEHREIEGKRDRELKLLYEALAAQMRSMEAMEKRWETVRSEEKSQLDRLDSRTWEIYQAVKGRQGDRR